MNYILCKCVGAADAISNNCFHLRPPQRRCRVDNPNSTVLQRPIGALPSELEDFEQQQRD